MKKKPNGRIDPNKIKATHLQHLYRIARAVAGGKESVVQVRDLARYVVGKIRHQLHGEALERTKLRQQLRAAAREHQADLAQDVAAGRARPAPKFSPRYYRGSHG